MYDFVGADHWTRTTVFELARWKNGLAFKNINFTSEGRPVIKIAELKAGITDQTKFTNAEYNSDVRVQKGDMLFSWSGNPDTSIDVFRWDGPVGWLNQHIYKVYPSENVDDEFLFFLLRSLRPRFAEIARNKQTTGLGHVTLGDFKQMVVGLPTMVEQESIVAALGPIEQKIELNRRMNETLEAQARALFRDWFVDFGPVKAKMAGTAPYLASDLWSLFPNRLDDDGVPEGWLTYRVDEIADHHTKSLKPMDAASEFFEHFSLPAYDGGQQPVLEAGGGIKSNKTIVPDGAILLSKLNPEIPRVWWPQNKGAHRQIASTEFLAFTAKSGISPALIYSLFRDQTFRQRLEGMVTGTSKSHQRISPPALRSLEALVGDEKVFTAFGEIITSLMQKVLANRAENLTLAQTRDLLLPKLMSGEIRVGDGANEELSAA